MWELVSDSRTQPELLGGRIVILLSELMRDRAEFIGTPTELSAQIDPAGSEGITPKKVSRLILQSVAALSKIGISAVVRRSNGKRLIELRRAESDDTQGTQAVDPIDPADVSGGENAPCFGVCALVCDPSPKAECVPAFACESERGAFVREVENRNKKRFGTALRR